MITYIVSCMVIMIILLIIGQFTYTEERKEAERKLKEDFNTDVNRIWLISILTSPVMTPIVLLMKAIKLIRFLCKEVDKKINSNIIDNIRGYRSIKNFLGSPFMPR